MSNKKDFRKLIELKMGCGVPLHIQNIFALNGFENAVSIKTITKDDFDTFTNFARNDMHKRIPEDSDLKEFYGSY